MKTYTHFWSYLAQFFLELEIFQKNFVQKSLNCQYQHMHNFNVTCKNLLKTI